MRITENNQSSEKFGLYIKLSRVFFDAVHPVIQDGRLAELKAILDKHNAKVFSRLEALEQYATDKTLLEGADQNNRMFAETCARSLCHPVHRKLAALGLKVIHNTVAFFEPNDEILALEKDLVEYAASHSDMASVSRFDNPAVF